MSTTSSLDSFPVSKEEHTVVTRHLYDKHSVQKALLSATLQKHPLRKHYLAFWSHELYVSEEWALLGTTLAHALMYAPPSSTIHTVWQSWDPTSLSFVQKAVSCLAFPLEKKQMPLPCKEPVDKPCSFQGTVPAKPEAWTENQRARLAQGVQRAFIHKHGEQVYRLLCTFPPQTALLYLTGVEKVPKPLLEAYKTTKRGLQHIVWFLGCHWNESVEPDPVKFPTLQVGTRSARMFGIPAKYIHFPLHLGGFDVLRGCAFWQRVLTEHGVNRSASVDQLVFSTEEAMESFYKTYFPDDIPDEWSKEERQKSHC
jgi:hypothetical protein